MSGIILGSGITVGAGIALGQGSPSPTLMLSLDAAGYTSGPWVDSVSSRSFTLNGGVTYDSGNGGCLVFDPASSQYAECTSSLSNLSTWTVELWHYYTGTNDGVDGGSGASLITEVFTGTPPYINYSIGNDAALGSPTDLQSGFFDGAWRATPTGYTLTAGNWYQIVGTYDGSTIKLYVNNTLVEQTSYSGTPASSTHGIRLMRRWDNADFWGGKLGIVKIYDGDIGQAGVTTSWNANKARFGLGPNPGTNNVTGYNEMNPPIIPGNQLEDGSATINGSTGFTINNDTATGIAIPGLTSSNVTWFAANYPTVPGYYNVTWGPGSTVASSSIYVVQKPSSWPGGPLVFFVQGQTGAATYNYPFTFSV